MPDTTPNEEKFLAQIKALADNVQGKRDLRDNPDMELLFTVSIFASRVDHSVHATQVTREFAVPFELIGLELLQIGTRIIEQGDSNETD